MNDSVSVMPCTIRNPFNAHVVGVDRNVGVTLHFKIQSIWWFQNSSLATYNLSHARHYVSKKTTLIGQNVFGVQGYSPFQNIIHMVVAKLKFGYLQSISRTPLRQQENHAHRIECLAWQKYGGMFYTRKNQSNRKTSEVCGMDRTVWLRKKKGGACIVNKVIR